MRSKHGETRSWLVSVDSTGLTVWSFSARGRGGSGRGATGAPGADRRGLELANTEEDSTEGIKLLSVLQGMVEIEG